MRVAYRCTRGLNHLQSMLVGTGLKPDIASGLPVKSGDRVGGDHFIGVANMRSTVRIMNRGGDIIGIGHIRALYRVVALVKSVSPG